jgi:N-acetyl-anhydromuramyl-L-alanine amidase AmpD
MRNGPIKQIVLHYSATYPDQDIDIRDIDQWHKAKGWKGVGYHYVIKRDGMIERGRKEDERGAHVGGQNANKIGICVIGGLDRKTGREVGVDNRTDAQIRAQIALIRELLTRYPDAEVVGHKDLAPTQCPGYDVRSWWAEMNASKPAPAFNIWEAIKAAIAAFLRRE